MAIDPDILNAKMALSPHVLFGTGVYLDHMRHSAIVVRVKEDRFTFITTRSGSVTLEACHREVFLHDWAVQLPNYPVLRAVRSHLRPGLNVSADAGKILRSILERANT